MISTPGYGVDLDRSVADALRWGEPNIRLPDPNLDRTDSLLMLVAINQRADLARILLEAGATITTDELSQILWWWPTTEIVTCLLEFNTPFNTHSVEAAISHGQWNVVEILLDHGADIDGVYRATYLLHIAAALGEQAFLESLLRRGANVHLRFPGGRTALMKACDITNDAHKATPLIVETLLHYGSDPNAVTAEGESSLLLCTAQQLPNFPKRTEIARILLRYGADPNWASRSGTTALMLAARDNDLPLAIALMEANASPHIKRQDGRTARDIAIQYQADEVLAFLNNHRGDA